MSQENARQPKEALKPSSAPSLFPQNRLPPLSTDKRIVEVSEPKKKISVIQIEDSEEEVPQPPKVVKAKESKQQTTDSKPKKVTHRCMICRQSGKKATMKACLDCRCFTHIVCLQQEGQQTNRHICRKCQYKRQEKLRLRKEEKPNGDDKMASKKIQKEKRREEQVKKMGEFSLKYPYYVQEERVRFPVEDKLLFIYKELFEISEVAKPQPTCHPLIPASLLADLLQIQNFFSTFREELAVFGTTPPQINKSIFFLSLQGKGIDGIFSCMLECILNIYLSDIFEKNKTDNVKTLNDHSFFTLMTHLHENQELTQEILVRSGREVIRYLSSIPSMRNAFDEFEYPDEMDLRNKIRLVVGLINGLSQIDEFHELVQIKSQKMQMLTKQKTELIAQLKTYQAQILSNNEKLKDMMEESRKMEESQEGTTREMTKEYDKLRRRIIKLSSDQIKQQEAIRVIKKKIGQIGKVMPFLTSQILYLGQDRNQAQYFFFLKDVNRIYVKNRAYVLDTNENFFIFQGKSAIIQLFKTLNIKGFNQKHLSENIMSLIKDEIITNEGRDEDGSSFIIEESKYSNISLQDVLNMIRETEETFTTYLTVKEYQWASETYRELFMNQFNEMVDLQVIKEHIKALQENFLFAEIAFPDIKPESDDEIREQIKKERKKIPIRLWGINSERTKKHWCDYLEECIDVIGVWICAYIFKSTVDKYVKKKMETYYEQQERDRRFNKNRENGNRGRFIAQQAEEKTEKTEKLSRTIKSDSSDEVVECRRPNLRARRPKRMNIDSDVEVEVEPQYQEISQSSSNEDCCEVCQEYGEMICCDTCPKVYHVHCLKMSDVPEGEWSCFKCLEKITNERQTRSRVKKFSKFM